MTSFRFDVGVQSRFIARQVGRMRGELARAISEMQLCSGLTLDDIANKMGVETQEVEKLLSGEAAFSLRRFIEMLAALEQGFTFEIARPSTVLLCNHNQSPSTRPAGQVLVFGAAARPSTTVSGMQQMIRKLVYVDSQ